MWKQAGQITKHSYKLPYSMASGFISCLDRCRLVQTGLGSSLVLWRAIRCDVIPFSW